mgnify:CR=1 FL=1
MPPRSGATWTFSSDEPKAIFSAAASARSNAGTPLPGGTTGHAVGVGIAAIVLGPWASILAISVALIIQAIFFGDGGITALGSNILNMGLVGGILFYPFMRWMRALDHATHSLAFTTTPLPAMSAEMDGPRMFCSG